MAVGIGKVSQVSSLFVGLGDHLIGDAITDAAYATATLDTILANVKSLGDILNGSTSYSGSDASTEDWKNEQGITITSTTTDAGSISYDFTCQNFTDEMKTLLLGAESITGVIAPSWSTDTAAITATGWGHKSAIIVRPFVFLDETKTKCLVIPKGKATSSLTMDGNKQCIKVTVVAEKLDTPKLKTIMSFDVKGVKYATA